jgi:hypothetical protein
MKKIDIEDFRISSQIKIKDLTTKLDNSRIEFIKDQVFSNEFYTTKLFSVFFSCKK